MIKDFNKSFEIIKSDATTGIFEGILTKGSVIDSHGDYFSEESIKNFKTKNDSNTVFLLHQHNREKELGTMEIWSENGDLRFKAQLDLSTDENGNYINKDAIKVYSLMKQGAKYDMSVGGRILKGNYEMITTEKGDVNAFIIKEFEVFEGSVVVKGSVPGSAVETVKQQNNIKGDEDNMELNKQFEQYKEETTKAIQEIEKTLGENINKETRKELESIQKAMQEKLDSFEKAINDGIDSKLNEFAREAQSIEETKKELTDTDFEKSLGDFFKSVNSDTNERTDFNSFMSKANATSAVPQAVLPQLSRIIIKRIQETKSIWNYVSKITMKELSIKMPREALGMPEVKFVGESANRTETTINFLDQVEIELHQIYALPIFTNKLLATDVVGFVALVLERIAESFANKISEKVLYGSGVGEPAGILTNTKIIAGAISFAGAGVVDYETLTKAKYKLKEDYARNAIVVMNRQSAPHFMNLKDNSGRPIFLDAYTDSQQDRLTGLTVVYDDALPTFDTAVAGDVVVLIGDAKKYLGASHTDYNIKLEDKITQKGFTAYYFETMVGGNVLLPEAFVAIKKA